MGPQKKNIISLSLKDQGSANTELYFSESEKGGGGGSQKSELETSKTTQQLQNHFIVCLINFAELPFSETAARRNADGISSRSIRIWR